MGRPRGSKNVITKESAARIGKLVERHGSPVRAMFKSLEHWVGVRDAELAKTSRHRNGAKIDKANEWILKFATALAPYTDKKQPTAVQTENTQKFAVVRCPPPAKSTADWLEKYGPGRTSSAEPMRVLEFSKQLRTALDTAEAVGIDDAEAILNEAKEKLK